MVLYSIQHIAHLPFQKTENGETENPKTPLPKLRTGGGNCISLVEKNLGKKYIVSNNLFNIHFQFGKKNTVQVCNSLCFQIIF